MLNFIAISLTAYLVNGPLLAPGLGQLRDADDRRSGAPAEAAAAIDPQCGFLIALALLLLYWLWGRRTALGFETRVAGLNARFCRRASGIDVPMLDRQDDAALRRYRRAGRRHTCARHRRPLRLRLLAGLRLHRHRGCAARAWLGGRHFPCRDPVRRTGLRRGRRSSSSATFRSRSCSILQGTVMIFAVARFGWLFSNMAGATMIDNVIHAAIVMTTPMLLAAIGGLVNRVGGLVNIGLEFDDAGRRPASRLIIASATGSWRAALVAALLGRWRPRAPYVARRHPARRQRDHRRPRLQHRRCRPGALLPEVCLRQLRERSTCQTSSCCRASTFRSIADIPILGAILSGHDPLTWVAWLLVPADRLRSSRARGSGLRLRAAGALRRRSRALGLRPAPHSATRSTVFAGADGRARRRLSLDRCRRDLQRGHHGRPRLHRAGRLLFRPQSTMA